MDFQESLKILNIDDKRLKELKNLSSYITEEQIEETIDILLNEFRSTFHQSKCLNKNFAKSFKQTLCDFMKGILTGNKYNILKNIELISSIHYNKETENFLIGYIKLINLFMNKFQIPKEQEENFTNFITILLTIFAQFLSKNLDLQKNGVDDVTKLHSKNVFIDRFTEIVSNTKTIAIVDISNFKNINLYHGFETGNNVLMNFSSILKTNFPNAFITRIQNDEFLILANEDSNTVFQKLRKIQNELQKEPRHILPNQKSNLKISFTSSIVDETYCPTGNIDYLLWILYNGLEKARNRRNQTYVIFPKEITKAILDRKLLLDVIDAIKKQNMKLGLHGIYSLNNPEKILFKEALARIKIKDTVIEAGKFIDIIAKTNIEGELDKLMVENVFKYIKNKNPHYKISINLSYYFMKESFSWFIDKIKKYEIDPEQIVVELTERDDILEIPGIYEKLEILRQKGISIFIDDFGVKYANYEILRALPIDGIKLEGSIVKNIEEKPLDVHFINFSIQLAKEKNLSLVAEFIETEKLSKKIIELSEKENFKDIYGQGFLFEKVEIVE